MTQRHVKQRKDQNLLLFLGVFVAALLFDSFRDLFLHGWSAKRAFSIAVVLFSYPFPISLRKRRIGRIEQGYSFTSFTF